ncbi:SH3 domain-containing protein [Devosia algicola]|uniref:SH3 domain-containing protein n=1 Tax=Devosia algicola TaxID=3026418 RepID=A0ABY7YJ27_9HYPH|nr:SH3 domain-containing protein [Devosia algicola]WDR01271.1 SH3 domain-containing protein [Devosia algicola]
MKKLLRGAFAISVLMAGPVAAQTNMPSEPIVLPAGSSSAVIRDRVDSRDSLVYDLAGSAGEAVTITLSAVTSSANFNVNTPDGQAALFVGSRDGRMFSGVLPENGDYTILVYLVGQASETGGADITLTVTRGDEPMASEDAIALDAMGADFADGLAGGPDFWEVHSLRDDDTLNIRTGPSLENAAIGKVSNGTVMRNLGCEKPRSTIWCQVEATDGTMVKGWAASRYLREAAAPTGDAGAGGHPGTSRPR